MIEEGRRMGERGEVGEGKQGLIVRVVVGSEGVGDMYIFPLCVCMLW